MSCGKMSLSAMPTPAIFHAVSFRTKRAVWQDTSLKLGKGKIKLRGEEALLFINIKS